MNNIFNDYIKLLYLIKFLIRTGILPLVPEIIYFMIIIILIIFIKIDMKFIKII